MDPVTVSAIVMGATALTGVLGKVLFTFRRNVKSCFGVNFRSPTPSVTDNPQIDMKAITYDAQQATQTVRPSHQYRERLESQIYYKDMPHIRSVEC